jgi:hypothetical protein
MSPANTTTLHLPSLFNTLCSCTALQSQNRMTCADGNRIPTVTPFATFLLPSPSVTLESSYRAVNPAIYLPLLTKYSANSPSNCSFLSKKVFSSRSKAMRSDAVLLLSDTYVSNTLLGLRPLRKLPSFHPRLYPSCNETFMPCPAFGECVCAASPVRKTR